MGQQQLLLIVLGVIIVGIAVAVGIQMFSSSAATANFDAVINDLQKMASDAQGWFRKPVSLGGGGRDFTTLTLASIGAPTSNANATYTIASAPAQAATVVTFRGQGVEDGDDVAGNVDVRLAVYADSTRLFVDNR